MIAFRINRVPTLFIKGFTPQDGDSIVDFVFRQGERQAKGGADVAVSRSGISGNSEMAARNGDNLRTVLFIDTPVTEHTVAAVERLHEAGMRVVFRDHHGLEAPPQSERERLVENLVARLERMLGADCLITKRSLHPACSRLVSVGEFADALAVVADPDADGLTAAMKAVGVFYPGLDEDASLLDGEPALQVTGSPLSALLAKGMATLPSYEPSRPGEREKAQESLFSRWVAAVQGDVKALAHLEAAVEIYDQAVDVARSLAAEATEVAPGVVLVNAVNSALYDPGTLIALMEERSGTRVTVIRKDRGPIAAHHGVQYSLSVTRAYQGEINLQKLVPAESTSDPRLGLISNVSFLLHVCENNWREQVLPSLKRTMTPVLIGVIGLALALWFSPPVRAQLLPETPVASPAPVSPINPVYPQSASSPPGPLNTNTYSNSGSYMGPSSGLNSFGGQSSPAIPGRVGVSEPALLPQGMLVTTTYQIDGYRVREYKGIVRGVMVREPTIGQNFKAGFQGMFGGHVGAYMQMCEQGRQQSYAAMVQNAQALGANAVIGVSYDSDSFAVGPDQFATEVVCYGTAVVIEAQR